MPLTLTPNFSEPGKRYFRAFSPGDDFYELLIDAHRDLDDAQSAMLNAQLILLLANHIGDLAVLLNLPVCVLEEVDTAVREQGVTRTQFLRQAVERNLSHYQRCERAIFARIYQQGYGWRTTHFPPLLDSHARESAGCQRRLRCSFHSCCRISFS